MSNRRVRWTKTIVIGRRNHTGLGAKRPGPFFMKGSQLATIPLDAQGNSAAHDQVLFTVPKFEDLQIEPQETPYDIMPDGQHFVFELGGHSSSPTTHYNLVLNWFTELKKKMNPPR